jgi:2,3-dihydroxyphenylpropionate 1,2-dioxygenase
MSVAIICASHTPLMYRGPASNETEQRVRTAFERLGAFVKAFEPDYVIQFAPDHFNGFFYDLMPSFCVGAGAVSLGDWGGGTGPLDVPEQTALELVDHVRAEDFDVAVSYRMPVDHGFVQMWEAVLAAPGSSVNPSVASRQSRASACCSPPPAACRTIRRCHR